VIPARAPIPLQLGEFVGEVRRRDGVVIRVTLTAKPAYCSIQPFKDIDGTVVAIAKDTRVYDDNLDAFAQLVARAAELVRQRSNKNGARPTRAIDKEWPHGSSHR
jgi:hypothetical protein